MFLFLKKAFCKKAALLGLALVLLTSVLFISCDDGGGSDPVNAKQPSITTQPSETTDWDVSTTDSIDLTVAATSPDGGVISYQWYSNMSASNTGGSIMGGKTEATLTLAKNDYLVNGNYYFYAITTNTNNSVNGTNTATAASSAATVTVSGNASLPITSQADMEKIGTGTDGWLMSATYVLANDITLTDFTPVGIEATPFTGTFLGNGKTITLTSFASVTTNRDIGIFGYVKGASASTKAVIKNLTVQSSVNVTETATDLAQNVGLVSGYAEYAEIDNIMLSGTFSYTSNGRIYLGGIVGTINQTGTVVKNSASSMTMNISPAGNGTIAPINSGAYHYVGGFAGCFANGAGIEDCHNSGIVTVDNVARSGGQVFAGGITGGSPYGFSTTYKGYVQDSSLTGTITVKNTGNWTFVGGIAGTMVGGNVNDLNATTKTVRCFVEGTVSCVGSSANFLYIGGIVGYNYYGALVSQCYFDGNVLGGSQYNGGIVGYNSQTTAPANSRVEDCWSAGTAVRGGIAGENQVNTYIRRCYSRMDGVIGGIAGLGGGISISDCVALNTSVQMCRITQTNLGMEPSNLSNNYALPDLSSDEYEEGDFDAWDISDKGAMGKDIPAQYMSGDKPTQNFYVDVLKWDFTNVWKWDSASGYPVLKWQN